MITSRKIFYCPYCRAKRVREFPNFRITGALHMLIDNQYEVYRKFLEGGTDRKLTPGDRRALRRALKKMGGRDD